MSDITHVFRAHDDFGRIIERPEISILNHFLLQGAPVAASAKCHLQAAGGGHHVFSVSEWTSPSVLLVGIKSGDRKQPVTGPRAVVTIPINFHREPHGLPFVFYLSDAKDLPLVNPVFTPTSLCNPYHGPGRVDVKVDVHPLGDSCWFVGRYGSRAGVLTLSAKADNLAETEIFVPVVRGGA